MKTAAKTVSAFVGAVAEMQGLDGPFSFHEKLLQKIWRDGDFEEAQAVTADGRTVRVVHPGKWNLLGGPDFKAARLRLGRVEVTGDVELHLRAGDWSSHAHAADPAYDHVVLHVVLFPAAEKFSRGRDGRRIPVLALLPLLHRGLEADAAEDAVEALAGRPASQVLDELGPLPPDALDALLRHHAGTRWRQKVHFARVRLERLGWNGACHHAALEILGYRFNRVPMLRIASARPLFDWRAGEGTAAEAFAVERGRWSLQGVRLANHPQSRLRQYAAWVGARPDWPERLAGLARALPPLEADAAGASTADFRRTRALGRLRARIAAEVCGGAVGGTRLDNLVCDGFWPLLAARGAGELLPWWFHWPAGDLPAQVTGALRALGGFTGRGHPACHGFAQGLIGWQLAREDSRGLRGCGT